MSYIIYYTSNNLYGSYVGLNARKCCDLDYIFFITAFANVFTCTEAARCHPSDENSPSHDAFTRLLQRHPQDTEALWKEANDIVSPQDGFLILDDTTLDKPYAKKMDLVCRHWSGKHHRTVNGINLVTLVWTDGHAIIPVDFRIYRGRSTIPHDSISPKTEIR